MVMKKLSGLVCALLIVWLTAATISPVWAQKKYDKMVAKVKDAYDEGDYIMAAKYNTKLRKKVKKKLGDGHKYMVTAKMLEARIALASGMLFDFENKLAETIELSKRVNSEVSVEHALILNDAAALMLQNGNSRQAATYIAKAREIIDKIDDDERTRNILAYVNLNAADILTTQGFYAKAIDFISESESFYAGRATSKVTMVDAKSGKLKTVKLSAREVAQRLDDYARLMNLKAKAYSKMGDFLKADETFLQAADWIDNNLGKSNIRYVENLLLQGKMLEENGAAPKVTRKIYEDALAQLKKKHLESHYLALEIYEALLNSYLRNLELAKFKNLASEYERVIKKYFKKQSIVYLRLDALKFRYQLANDRNLKVESKVKQLLANTQTMPEYHATRIKLMEFGYKAALDNRQYDIARQYLEQILEQKKELYGEESPEFHLTKTEVANYYVDYTDKLQEAGEIYVNSFEKIVKPQITPGHVSYVRTLNHLAKYYEITDQLDKATAMLDEALKATRVKYDDQDINYAIELQKIAALKIKIGDYKGAEENIEAAIDLLHKERRDRHNAIYYVMSLETKAKLLALQGSYTEARNLLIRAQKFLYRAEDLTQYDELASEIELADIKIKLGRKISETETMLQEVLAAYQQLFGNDSYQLIEPLLRYGDLRLFTGDYAEAEKIARRAQKIATDRLGENSSKVALSDILLARIYTALGDYEKAKQNIQDALKIQEAVYGHDHIMVARSLSELGLVMFYNEDDPAETEKVYNDAKNIIAQKLGNRTPLYAELMKNLSLLYIQQNRFNEAFTSLSIAKNIWEERLSGRGNASLAGIYGLTGDLYYQKKDYEKAADNYLKAQNMYNYFFNPDHPEYVRVLSKLSKVYYMQGDRRKAKKSIEKVIEKYDQFIKNYLPALSEREKAKFWNTIKGDYEFYVSVAMVFRQEDPRMIEQVFNNALLTKAILLSSSIKIRQRIMNGDDEELKKLYNEWLEKKELLTTALAMSTEQLIENEIDPIVIQEEVELLEKELSERSELIKESNEQRKVEWQDVQSVLKPGEVAIEFIRYRYFDHVFTDSVIYAGLYLKPAKEQSKPGVFTLNNGHDLETKYFKAYKNSIIFRIRDRFSYKQFWQPIASAIGNPQTIYLSPDGVFNQINLEAIPIDNEKYVIDVANIIVVSNTKDIYLHSLKQQQKREKIAASMFGNPIYYLESEAPKRKRISQLVGTEEEIKELKELLAAKGWEIDTKLEVSATEQAVKTVDSPDILHIATHGFFTPAEEIKQDALQDQLETKLAANPLLRTGLLFAGAGDLLNKTQFNYNMEDGILTAYEAMSMNLDKTELVVLSACETGLGDLSIGEGVYGLQRAFMVAGAKTLIMSMFKVDDKATQKLMINFYKKWLETGKKRESFVAAKKELREEFKDPIFWGAFIMIGLE